MSCTVITLCVVSQRVFIVVSVYFVIVSVRKLLDALSYATELSIHNVQVRLINTIRCEMSLAS
jgi:hypothetical protein